MWHNQTHSELERQREVFGKHSAYIYIYKLYTHVFAIVPQKQYFQREREYCRLVLEVCQEKYIDLEACLQSGTLSWMWQSCW